MTTRLKNLIVKKKTVLLGIVAPVLSFLVFLAAFSVLEWMSFEYTESPVRHNDSKVFERISKIDASLTAFYTNSRPFTGPLLYKISQRDVRTVWVLQSILSVVSWAIFGISLITITPNRWLKWICLPIICFFSLSIPINQWDAILLSESLAFSLSALSVGLTIIMLVSVNKNKIFFFSLLPFWLFSCLLCSGARDSSSFFIWIIEFFLIFIAFGTLLQRLIERKTSTEQIRRTFIIAACVVPVILFANWSQTHSRRWHTPLLNVILGRVITNSDTMDFWVEKYEFPRNSYLYKYAGKPSWVKINDRVTGKKTALRGLIKAGDKRYSDVQSWMSERGVTSYKKFLLWDALGDSLSSALKSFVKEVNSANVLYGKETAGYTGWTTALSSYAYPMIRSPYLVLIFAIIWSCISLILSFKTQALSILIIFFVTASFSQAFIGFHGDAAEVSRHSALVGVLFRLGLITWFLLIAQNIIDGVYWMAGKWKKPSS